MKEVTHNNLPEAISELLKEVGDIKKLLTERSNAPPSGLEGLLTTIEVSKLLGLSKSTIVHLKKIGLPYYKVKDSVKFCKKDVLDFMEKYKQVNNK